MSCSVANRHAGLGSAATAVTITPTDRATVAVFSPIATTTSGLTVEVATQDFAAEPDAKIIASAELARASK